MLIACWTKPPSRGLMVNSSQYHRARWAVKHDQTRHRRRPTQQWTAIAGMRRMIETRLEFKKCSLGMTGKVPAPASRIHERVNRYSCRFPEITRKI